MGGASSSYALDRAVAKCFEGLPNITTYADDIALHNQTFDDHMKTLEEVLDRIIENGFLLNPTKSKFVTEELNFLGFTISPRGVSPDMSRAKELEDLPPPSSIPDVRRFIGILGYFVT